MNEVIVFTGFRDDDLVDFIETNGGKTTSKISKKTTLVVYNIKNKEKSKKKLGEAEQNNILTIEVNEFKKKYNYQ